MVIRQRPIQPFFVPTYRASVVPIRQHKLALCFCPSLWQRPQAGASSLSLRFYDARMCDAIFISFRAAFFRMGIAIQGLILALFFWMSRTPDRIGCRNFLLMSCAIGFTSRTYFFRMGSTKNLLTLTADIPSPVHACCIATKSFQRFLLTAFRADLGCHWYAPYTGEVESVPGPHSGVSTIELACSRRRNLAEGVYQSAA